MGDGRALIGKAQTALASAKLLLDAGDADGAANRAYYAMFYATLAALLWAGSGAEQNLPKTHSGLIGSFGQNLVQTKKLSPEFGRALNRVQELRLMADYLAELVTPDKATWAIEEADRFVAAVTALLLQPKPTVAYRDDKGR